MIVLDSAAFINESIFDKEQCYTVQGVIDELKDFKSKQLAESAIAAGKLKLSLVDPVYLKKVREAAVEVGSFDHLSETDLDVTALALQLEAKIISDDYTVQNLAAHLNLKFEGVLRGEIKEKKKFR